MTLRLTKEVLAAAYDYLRSTAPFCTWGLPPSDQVVFRVMRSKTTRAKFLWVPKGSNRKPEIHVSARCNGHTHTLMAVLSHEMVHLKQNISGEYHESDHGPKFDRRLNQICRIHGFDPLWFS